MDIDCSLCRRTLIRVVVLTALALSVAHAAHAHVTVQPREAAAKSSTQLTIRVPNEKDVPTESIRLEFPPALQVLRLKPLAGWATEVERDADGKISAITYKGSMIGREEYQEFSLIARLPDTTGPTRIKAFQNYVGEQVAWVNDAEPRPAPTIVVTPAVVAAAPAADSFAAPAPAAPGAGRSSGDASSGGASTGGWLGATSLVLSALALLAALRPRRATA